MLSELKVKVTIYEDHLWRRLKNQSVRGLHDDDNRLMKFHGSYLQDDRDLRNERQRQKLEPAYQFMVRVRAPGGVATSEQWLVMDRVANKYGNGTLKLTTRQAFQMHGILKWNMKKNIQEINECIDGYIGSLWRCKPECHV